MVSRSVGGIPCCLQKHCESFTSTLLIVNVVASRQDDELQPDDHEEGVG